MEQGAAIKVTKSVAHSCAILIHSQIFNIKIVPSKEDIIINDLYHSGGTIFPPLQLLQCLMKHGLSKRKQVFDFVFFLSFWVKTQKRIIMPKLILLNPTSFQIVCKNKREQ
jgi:hypothetical protein